MGADRIKVFLFVLVRDLEFAIDPTLEIEKKVKYVPPLAARCCSLLTAVPVSSR